MNKEKKEKEQQKGNEEANITMESKIRNKSFYFNTVCTAHLTLYAEYLLNNTKCSEIVKASLQESMEISGNGDVIMECVRNDGSVSSFCILDVLHVPMMGQPVISWRKLRTKEYTEFEEGDYISINEGTKVMFKAVLDRNLCKIPEISHSANIIYDFWHKALGHVAPLSMDNALKLYSDADIAAKPNDFICDSCVKS